MSDIKKLLSKKGWTGKELGQIEVSNMAYTFSQRLQGKDPKPLVSKGEFNKMLNTLKNPIQGKAYNGYLAIHNWINVAYNIASGQEQQAQSNFKTLLQYATVFETIEGAFEYTERLPLIMTQKQYDDYVEERIKEITHPQGLDLKISLFSLFMFGVEGLVRRLINNPRKANPLKALKPKLEKEKVKDPRILSRYNEVMGHGYYTIDETGERSDQMTPEEWEEALKRDDIEPHNDVEKGTDYLKTLCKAKFNKASEEEIRKIKEELDAKYNDKKPCTFHLYADPPEDLNRWEILTSGELKQFYPSMVFSDNNGDLLEDEDITTNTQEELKAFKKEFAKVYDVVLDDLKKTVGEIFDTPIEEWGDVYFPWDKIYTLNLYDFKETFLQDYIIFDGNQKAIENGVAILREKLHSSQYEVDEKGYYIQPDIYKTLKPLSLDSFFPEYPEYADNAKVVELARKWLLDSYYWMLGFNKAIDLIIQYFDLPLIEVFKMDTDLMAERMEDYNNIIRHVYVDVEEGNYRDPELKQKRLQVINEFFYPLEYEDLSIPQEGIDKAIELFEDYEAFVDDILTSLLCIRQ